MPTLRIRIVDSKFVSHNGENVKTFEERYISGNGWEATISEEGKLECVALQYYGGVPHIVKLKVQKQGYARFIIKIGENPVRVLKKFKLETWPADVVLGLPGGYIDKRRPYIRRKEFQDFLDKYEISSVRNETPNGTYLLFREVKDEKVVYNETIETDGDVIPVVEDSENNLYRYEVTNASWVIKTVENHGKILRVLYTMDNPCLLKISPEN